MLPLRVVLVGPRGGANVGAVCRAMKNMGARELVVVGGDYDREQAGRMAVHARDVLEGLREADSLAEAVSGCGLVVGTTGRAGALRRRSEDVAAAAEGIVDGLTAQQPATAALVFGAEDTGLTNEEIALCHRLAFIPAVPDYPSLNLAQAVLVVLYEVRRRLLGRFECAEFHPSGLERAARRPADAAAVEAMLQALERALQAIGFLREEGGEPVMAALRSLLTRSGLDQRELRILRGIARQIRWFAEGGDEVARAKRARGEKLR